MKTWLLRTVFALVTLLVLALGLVLSPTGLDIALKIAKKTLPGTLTYQKIQGSILSPIDIKKFSYHSEDINVSIEKAHLDWNLPALLFGKLSIRNIQASNVFISNHTRSASSASEKNTAISLPLDLLIKDGKLDNIRYENLDAQQHVVIKTLHTKHLKITSEKINGNIQLILEKPYQVNSQMTLSGKPENYQVNLTSNYAQQSLHITATGNRKSARLVINNSHIHQGKIRGVIKLEWNPLLKWDAKLETQGLQLSRLNHNFPTIDKMTLISSGTWGNTPLFNIDATVSTLKNSIKIKGNYHQTWNLKWNAKIRELSALYKPYHGTITTQGSLEGPWLTPHIIATVNTKNIRIADFITDHANATLDIDMQFQKNSRIYFDASNTQLPNGQSAKQLLVQLNSTKNLKSINTNASMISDTGQKTALRLELAGTSFTGKEWDGTLTALNLSSKQAGIWLLKQPAKLQFSGKSIKLATTCLIQKNAQLCTGIDWNNAQSWQAMIHGNLEKFDLLTQFLNPNIQIKIPARFNIHASGNKDQLQALDVTINGKKGSITYFDGLQNFSLPVHHSQIAVKKDKNDLTATLAIITQGTDHIDAKATLPKLFIPNATLATQTILGDVKLNISSLKFLEAFFPIISNTQGTIKGNAKISGLITNPDIRGNLSITNGYSDIPKIKVRLNDINAKIDAKNGNFNYYITAKTENQPIHINGKSSIKTGKLITSIDISGKNLLISNTPEYTIYASPDLNIRIIGHGIVASGKILIPKARIRHADFSTTTTLPEDTQIIGIPQEEASSNWNWLMNIKVETGKDITVDSYGLKGHVVGELDLNRAEKQPAIVATGTLTLKDATFTTQGKKLEISEDSNVNYTHDLLTNPHLDIRAYRTVTTASTTQTSPIGEKTKVGISIQGTIKQPRISLFSSPVSLSQADIISYLLFDQPATGGNATGNLSLIIQAISSLKLSSKGNDFSLSQIKQTFGITELGVQQQTYLDALGTPIGINQSSFVIGSRITPEIYIRYNRGIMTDINIYQVRYLINNNWSVQLETYYGNDSWANGNGIDALYTVSPMKFPW